MTTPTDPLKAAIEKIERVSKWMNGLPIPTRGATAMMIVLRDACEGIESALTAAQSAPQDEREAYPFPLETESGCGWAISFSYLEKIRKRIEGSEFCPSLEGIEAALLAAFPLSKEGSHSFPWPDSYPPALSSTQGKQEPTFIGRVFVDQLTGKRSAVLNRAADELQDMARIYAAPVQPEAKPELVAQYQAALRSVNAVAVERGDKYGACDQIDNCGQPYQSQWLADLLAAPPQAEAQQSKCAYARDDGSNCDCGWPATACNSSALSAQDGKGERG